MIFIKKWKKILAKKNIFLYLFGFFGYFFVFFFLIFFPQEPLDLDDLLPVLGEFGCYQKLLLWFICLPACIPCGFCAFNQLFMTSTPDDYWCNVPELSEFNLTTEQIRSVAIPNIEVSCVLSINTWWFLTCALNNDFL